MGGDGEPLSDADARILGLESPAITGHTLNLMVLEPADRPLDAMADGIAGVRFLDAVLFDPRRPDSQARVAGVRGPAAPSRLTEARRMPEAVLRELGRPAARSPFDRPVGAARELTVVPLAQLKAIGASHPQHATVNDALLAVMAGGLRGWLRHGGAAVHRLRAQVPVSLHHRDESAGDLGNRDSFINVDLPLARPDPLTRLDLTRAETARRKQLGDADELFEQMRSAPVPAGQESQPRSCCTQRSTGACGR